MRVLSEAIRIVTTVILVSFLTGTPLLASDGYSKDMFRRAMARDNPAISGTLSTSPHFVLITIRDSGPDKSRQVCIPSTALTAAIVKEHNLHDEGAERQAFEIAVANFNHGFNFKSDNARTYVTPAYTPDQLDEVRKLVTGKSKAQLRQEVNVDLWKSPNEQGVLAKIYRKGTGKGLATSYALRVALAHVLLEKGIPVGENTHTGTLFTEE